MPQSATDDEVRRAYLQRVREVHPDQFASGAPDALARAERLMKDLNVAWGVLSDPAQRRAYDHDLRIASERGTTAAPPPRVQPTGPVRASGPSRPASAGWTNGAGGAHSARREPQVARPEEMEPGGLGRLVRKGPILGLVLLFGLILLIATIAGGGGDDADDVPLDRIVIPTTGVEPIGCFDLLPQVVEVPCAGTFQAVAWAEIGVSEECPAQPPDLVAYYRDGVGGQICVIAND